MSNTIDQALTRNVVQALVEAGTIKPDWARAWLLHTYGDDRRLHYTSYSGAQRLGMKRSTYHLNIQRAAERIEPALELAARQAIENAYTPPRPAETEQNWIIPYQEGDEIVNYEDEVVKTAHEELGDIRLCMCA